MYLAISEFYALFGIRPGTCEVRPGPEYLLRWHYYSENGTFRHNTYVYKDDGCSKPVWSRCVKGRYGVRGRSLHMPDASQADFTLQEVMVMVYSGTFGGLGTDLMKQLPVELREAFSSGIVAFLLKSVTLCSDIG
ncbi:unnamed protein product, partial [Nesidiocoris tenuis]